MPAFKEQPTESCASTMPDAGATQSVKTLFCSFVLWFGQQQINEKRGLVYLVVPTSTSWQRWLKQFATVIVIIVIVITFYSPNCLSQETAKEPCGLRSKLPPAHMSTTHGGGFTLSL